MTTFELFALRLTHVLGGIFWVGSALFTSFFLVPALATSGVNAGEVMTALRRRHLMTFLPLVALLTIGSGVRLIWIASAGSLSTYVASPQGRAFALAGTAAIIAFLVSLTVARPAATRAAVLGRALGSAPEVERARLARELDVLRRRNAVASTMVVTLLLLGSAGMAVAKYLR
jgi:uncharacterized membrane protein